MEREETVKKVSAPVGKTPHQVKGIGKARYLKVSILTGHPGIWEMRVY